jgi:hypothetical protein
MLLVPSCRGGKASFYVNPTISLTAKPLANSHSVVSNGKDKII